MKFQLHSIGEGRKGAISKVFNYVRIARDHAKRGLFSSAIASYGNARDILDDWNDAGQYDTVIERIGEVEGELCSLNKTQTTSVKRLQR